MNYLDFYKKEQALAGGKGDNLSPANVNPKELEMGITVEMEHTHDPKIAREIALDHLAEDPQYYSRLQGAGLADELPKGRLGGMEPFSQKPALDIPSRIRAVSIAKVINPATCFGGSPVKSQGPAAGSSAGVGSVQSDKETITAAGHADAAMAQKSVGGQVVPNQGQKQGGPNTQGNIAGTVDIQGKSPGQKCGPNSIGTIGGTSKNPQIGPDSEKLIKGAFAEKKEKEEVPLDEPESDTAQGFRNQEKQWSKSMAGDDTEDSADAADAEDQRQAAADLPGGEDDEDEEGKNVTIDLHESFKDLIKDIAKEIVREERAKNRLPLNETEEEDVEAGTAAELDTISKEPYNVKEPSDHAKELAKNIAKWKMKHGKMNEAEVDLDVDKIEDIEVGGVDPHDYPDFSDAYIVSAVYPIVDNPKGPGDWRELSEEELDWLNEKHPELANQEAHEHMHVAQDRAYDAYKDRMAGMEEVSAPGQEDWIKKHKKDFTAQYGKEKGLNVLYAKAWNRAKGRDESAELDEAGKKWIQKAIKKSHKGYCTPMTKPTCTPRRKALAKRFKSGDLSEGDTPKFKIKPKAMKKPATQTVSKLQKEAVFISRKINEGRELNDYECGIIKEIILEKALRIKEGFDDKDWEHSNEVMSGMLDSYIEDAVKYRSKKDSVEDVVESIVQVAEDQFGFRHAPYEAIEQQVRELWNKYQPRY